MKPLVTVIMPLFNAGRYVGAAIRSLLRQTLPAWRLIVVDDASTDDGPDIVEQFRDSRIVLVRRRANGGASVARNMALDMADTPYIALMDADNISLPRRLQRQVTYLDAHRHVGLIGSNVRIVREGTSLGFSRWVGTRWRWIGQDDTVGIALLFFNPLCASSVMFRRDLLTQRRFAPEYTPAEDYAFWVQASRVCAVRILPETLVYYRDHVGGVSKVRRDALKASTRNIIERQLSDVGITCSAGELDFHLSLADDTRTELPDVRQAYRWFVHLEEACRRAELAAREVIQRAFSDVWLYACLARAWGGRVRCLATWWSMPERYCTGVSSAAVAHLHAKAFFGLRRSA